MTFKSSVRELVRLIGIEREVKISSEFQEAVANLKPGSIALEFGANIGLYTKILAKSGAFVEAYEPDPVAFKLLKKRASRFSNVLLHEAAVSDNSGTAFLYRHKEFVSDPVGKSQGSSLMGTKHNVDAASRIEIKCIDIKSIFQSYERVDLMKMDIEGFEIPVLNRLLDTGYANRVVKGFVEVHDRKDPSLTASTNALRRRFSEMGLKQYNFDWH